MTVENNGPLPGSGSQRVPLSRQRGGVLEYLRGQAGPVTATALARLCALHVNTVREHLDALVAGGLAVREQSAPSGRGRPAWRYRARPPQASPAREYAGLAAVLAARIARSSADPRGDALAAGEEWGRVLTAGQEPTEDPQEARNRLLGLLEEIGFAPEADHGARRVRLLRCPFVETAREYPGVICGVHEGLARAGLAALGTAPQGIELLPFADPDACRLHLGAGGSGGDGSDAGGSDAGRLGGGGSGGGESGAGCSDVGQSGTGCSHAGGADAGHPVCRPPDAGTPPGDGEDPGSVQRCAEGGAER